MMLVVAGVALILISLWLAYARRYLVWFTLEEESAIKQALAARRTYRRAIKQNLKEIARFDRYLVFLLDPKGDLIVEEGGIVVWTRWIRTPNSEGSIMGVRAEVPGASSNPSGCLFLGLFSEPTASFVQPTDAGDFRALVVVNGPGFAGVGTIRGDDAKKVEKKAGDLVTTINATARSAEFDEPRKPMYIARVTEKLEELRNADPALNAARTAYSERIAEVPESIRNKFLLTP